MRTALSILALFAASVSSGAAQYDWDSDFDGGWEDSTKWSPVGYPQTADDIAYFGSTSYNRTITVGIAVVVGSIIFNDYSQTYTILSSGLGSITLDVTSGSAELTVQDGSHTINADLTFADAVLVAIAYGDVLTLGGTLTGSTAMTVDSTSSNGKLVLSGDNSLTYSGAITLVEGVISLGHASGLGTGTLSVNNTSSTTTLRTQGADYTISNALDLSNSATFALGASGSGNINIAGTVTLSRPAGSTHVVTVPSGEHTFSGTVTEANAGAKLLKKGSGSLVFSGVVPNTFTGALQIEKGTVVLNKTAGVTAINGDVEIGRGTSDSHILRLDADNQIADTSIIYLDPSGSGATATFDLNDHDETVGGIDFDGGTIQTGTGTLTLAGNLDAHTDTYQNETISGNLSLGGGTRIFDVSDNSSIENDLSISAVVSNGGISKQGSGTLELTAANTFAGGFNLSSGTVSIGSDSALGTGTATLTGGTVKANSTAARIVPNNVTVGGNVTISGAGSLTFQNAIWTLTGNRTLTVNNTANTTIASTITQDGSARSLTKAGTGNLIVTGNNTFSGGFRINAGTVSVGHDSALGSGTLTLAGGTIQADGTTPRILSQTVTQSGSVTIGGSGALTFDDSGTYWTISGGDRTITVDSTETATINKTINADYQSRTLTKAGSGTLVLGGSNPNVFNQSSGSTIVNEGTLVLSKDFNGVAAVRGPVIIGDGTGTSTLRLDGFGNQIGTQGSGNRNVTLNAGATGTALFDLNDLSQTVDALTFTGGSITSGTGTLTLNGNLTGNANSAEATISGNLSLNSGTRTLTIADGGASSDLSISAVVSSGALNKDGEGTLTLSGANIYSGKTTVAGGAIAVSADANLGAAPDEVIADQLRLDGGTLNATDTFSSSVNRGITLSAGGGEINVASGKTLTAPQIITGSGNLIKSGTGTLVLSGLNTYSGRTTISGGTVKAASDSALGTAPEAPVADQLTLNNGTLQATDTFSVNANRGISVGSSGATLSVDSGETLTVASSLEGSGSLTKSGTGTLVLSGSSSLTGNVIVESGTVTVLTDLRSSGGFIMNGGVLSGTGQLPSTTLNTGSFISPGNSPGTLESASQTWAGGSTYIWEINNAAGTQGQDPGWDLISITGELDITATSSSKFTIQVKTLAIDDTAGQMAYFDNTQGYSWTIATAGSIAGFDSSKFTIDSSGFLNDRNGGTLSLIEANNTLALQFVPVPEPEHYAFTAGLFLLGFAASRRYRGRTA